MKLSLKIVTPERIVYEDSVDSVSVMTQTGEITVLANHASIVTTLRAGEMRIRKNGEEFYLAASTGFLEVHPGNHVVILADSAERVEDLELEKIEEAKERARKLVEETKHGDHVAFANATSGLEREIARYHVAIKRRRRSR